MNKDAARLRALGVHDAEAGLPIDSFYELPLDRHTEALRAEYEIGYRSVKKQITPQVDTEGEWGAIYHREIIDSLDPVVRLANYIVYHCATVTPHTSEAPGVVQQQDLRASSAHSDRDDPQIWRRQRRAQPRS